MEYAIYYAKQCWHKALALKANTPNKHRKGHWAHYYIRKGQAEDIMMQLRAHLEELGDKP